MRERERRRKSSHASARCNACTRYVHVYAHIRVCGDTNVHMGGSCVCVCVYVYVCQCVNVAPGGRGRGQVGTLPGDGSCLPPREFIVLRSCAPPLRLHRFEATLRVHFFRLLRARAAATRASERVSDDPAPWIRSPRYRSHESGSKMPKEHTYIAFGDGDGTPRCFRAAPRTKGARPLGAALVRDFNRLFRVARDYKASLLGNHRRSDLRYFELCRRVVVVINKRTPFDNKTITSRDKYAIALWGCHEKFNKGCEKFAQVQWERIVYHIGKSTRWNSPSLSVIVCRNRSSLPFPRKAREFPINNNMT